VDRPSSERRRPDERPARRAFLEVAAPPSRPEVPAPAPASSNPEAQPERAPVVTRPALAAKTPVVVVAPPLAPSSALEPAWIPPGRTAHPRKKKAALTPKEALRAKVQSRAVKQAARPVAPAAEPGEVEARDPAAPPLAPSAEVVAEQPPPRARASGKPRRAPPKGAESEEPAPPPAKPGFFQRLLGFFRKR
jgi:hypothetical protein